MSKFTLVPIRRGLTELKPLIEIASEQSYVCGGYARWCTSPLSNPCPARDVDVYCESMVVYNTLAKKLDSYLAKANVSTMSITYHQPHDTGNPFTYLPPINLITPKSTPCTKGELENILSGFDFSVIRVGFPLVDNIVLATADTDYVKDETAHIIRICTPPFNCILLLTRIIKYEKYGYNAPMSEISKLFAAWDLLTKKAKTKVIKEASKGTAGSYGNNWTCTSAYGSSMISLNWPRVSMPAHLIDYIGSASR